MRFSTLVALWQPLLLLAQAIIVDPTSKASLISASQIAIDGMLTYYNGNQSGAIPGIFDGASYYWWMGGAAWNALMQYWWLTNDATYNDLVMQAMLFQVGPQNDYMPPNQTSSEGNDDQCFWALSAMTAAEINFPNPPANQPQWLALAQAVYDEQVDRWDTANCGGGLRWQINPFNNGYNYKNSIATGCHFHVAARLAKYTGNNTYIDIAERDYNWLSDIGLLTANYAIYDGADIPTCTTGLDLNEWTYNNGQLLSGAAYLYNYTNGNATWKDRLDSLLAAAKVKFFNNGVIWEPSCEPVGTCDPDQYTFKGFLAQYLSIVAHFAPYTASGIYSLLQSSAVAAGNHCNVGTSGQMCSMYWTTNTGSTAQGVGQQMSALNVFNANLMQFTDVVIFANNTGGTSQGNPNAGSPLTNSVTITPATTTDKVGAGILTALASIGLIGFSVWLVN